MADCLASNESIGKEHKREENIDMYTLAKQIARRIDRLLYEAPQDSYIGIISEQLHVSPSYGYRVFRKVFGISPRQYLTKIKLEHAQSLLLETNMSIEQIANQLGYQSASQFSRQFKRWTGQSPRQYKTGIER